MWQLLVGGRRHVEHAATTRTAHQRIGAVEQIKHSGGQASAAGAALTIADRGQRRATVTTLQIIVEFDRVRWKLRHQPLALYLFRFQRVAQTIEISLKLRLKLGPGCRRLLHLCIRVKEAALKLGHALKLLQHLFFKVGSLFTQQNELARHQRIAWAVTLPFVQRAQSNLNLFKFPLQVAAAGAFLFERAGERAATVAERAEFVARGEARQHIITLTRELLQALIDRLKLSVRLHAHRD